MIYTNIYKISANFPIVMLSENFLSVNFLSQNLYVGKYSVAESCIAEFSGQNPLRRILRRSVFLLPCGRAEQAGFSIFILMGCPKVCRGRKVRQFMISAIAAAFLRTKIFFAPNLNIDVKIIFLIWQDN